MWPNEVWYHYYYSKGSGLFFLGMLLADPLAPQLVTSASWLSRRPLCTSPSEDIAPETSWPSASVLLFISIYILTPGWGEFEKHHEFNTALLLGIIWMTQRALRAEGSTCQFIIAGALSIATAIIINTQIGAFYTAVFGTVTLVFLTFRDFRAAALCAGLSAWAACLVVFVLILNYATTGLPIDQPITRFWHWPTWRSSTSWAACRWLSISIWEPRG